jgi:hypothetical protein
MTKGDPVREFVKRFQEIPTDRVRIVAEHHSDEYYRFPMWGTMFLPDDWLGRRLWNHSRVVKDESDEMHGEHQIGDTPAYIYKIDCRFVVGVHAAGWDFYEGLWDKLYDLAGLAWHEWAEAGAGD